MDLAFALVRVCALIVKKGWNMFKSLLATAAIVLAMPVSAATFVTAAGAPDPGAAAGQSYVVTFDSAAAAGYTWSGNLTTATGSDSNAASPSDDGSRYGYVSSALNPNWALLSTPDLQSISFYWGSIDTYNTLEVLGAGGSLLLTLSGNTPGIGVPPIDGDQHVNRTNRRIFITADAGEVITGLRFTSTGVAFEFDDFAATAAAVPEPATWAMLIAGFGLVGFAARRRRHGAIAIN